jgi:hypothetical protein
MFGLAHTQTDGAKGWVRCNACKQLTQALKRIGVKAGKQRIHGWGLSSLAPSYFFLLFERVALDFAAAFFFAAVCLAAAGLAAAALGASPSKVFTGQILKAGHFWQPTARAMGQMVMEFLKGTAA